MEGTKAQPDLSSGAIAGSDERGPVYWSQAHKLAFERLNFAVTSRAPMTVFVGRDGSGRTSMVRELIARNTSGFVVRALYAVDQFSGDAMADVLSAFDPKGEPSENADRNRAELVRLLGSLHAAQRFPVLVVDNADELSNLYLGALCELCAQNAGDRPLLKLVFVGRPGMTDVLSGVRPDLTGPAFTLDFMNEDDVAGYIRARFPEIEQGDQRLGKDAIHEIFGLTSGHPARINAICGQILEQADRGDLPKLDKAQVRRIAVLAGTKRLDKQAVSAEGAEGSGAVLRHALSGAGFETDASGFETSTDTARSDVAGAGVGRKITVAAAVLVGAAGVVWAVSGPGRAFWQQLVALREEAVAGSQEVTEDAPAVEDVIAAPPPQPREAGVHEARLARISAALADAEPTATGQYLAALDLAGSASDAAVVGYARAALLGHARSAYYLGQIYETGEGVPVDLVLARAWYDMAAAGIDGAASRLEDLPLPFEDGALTEPSPLFARKLAGGSVELVWTSAEGADPASYRVELASASGDAVLNLPDLVTSAVRTTAPDEARQWRIIAQDRSGAEVASDWFAIGPE